MLTGSYGEHGRRLDTRKLKSDLDTWHVGGGVWRLRPGGGNKLLVAAMANILQENRGHDSLAHRADWVKETDVVTVSLPHVHSTIFSLLSGASTCEL